MIASFIVLDNKQKEFRLGYNKVFLKLIKKENVMVRVEEASLEDCERLCELLSVLFTQEKEFTPNASKQQRGLQMILNDASIGKVFVLKKEGHIIGMVSLLFTISTALGEKVAWLEDMIIDTPFQGKGYGKILLKEVLKKAKEFTCKRVSLKTDADNLRAQKVYEGLGFEYSTMKVMLYFTS